MQLEQLKIEVDDIKTAAAISEGSKQDEVELIRRKCQEEIASLQHIMAGEFLSFTPLSEHVFFHFNII